MPAPRTSPLANRSHPRRQRRTRRLRGRLSRGRRKGTRAARNGTARCRSAAQRAGEGLGLDDVAVGLEADEHSGCVGQLVDQVHGAHVAQLLQPARLEDDLDDVRPVSSPPSSDTAHGQAKVLSLDRHVMIQGTTEQARPIRRRWRRWTWQQLFSFGRTHRVRQPWHHLVEQLVFFPQKTLIKPTRGFVAKILTVLVSCDKCAPETQVL